MRVLDEDTIYQALKSYFNLKEDDLDSKLSNEIYYRCQEIAEEANNSFDNLIENYSDNFSQKPQIANSEDLK